MTTKTFKNNRELLADVIATTCANCYSETTHRIHIGSVEGFIFCSQECALDALKRRKG